MTWEATKWAKGQLRHIKGQASKDAKILLMALSEEKMDAETQIVTVRAPENGNVVTMEQFYQMCGLASRSCNRAMQLLEGLGLIRRVVKGNQHGHSSYRLNLEINLGESVSVAQSPKPESVTVAESAGNESVSMADSAKVKPPKRASETAKSASESVSVAQSDVTNKEVIPDTGNQNIYRRVFSVLYEIPGMVSDGVADARLTTWLEQKNVPAQLAEAKVEAMKASIIYQHGRWRYKAASGWREYTDLRAVLQTWVRMGLEQRNGHTNGVGSSPSFFDRKRINDNASKPGRRVKVI
ncbi:MAG: hypothetical protein L0177_06470 [Chloroflexi bacterium]|nr:hypothetical protein [Chloroflexota bacterium]